MAEKRAYQPIHESMRVRLDPEYVEFHDKVLQYVQPDDQIPWDPSCRSQPSVPMAMGAQKLVDVGDVQDHDLGDIQIRVFTPDVTTRPPQGWPTLVWLHGGGWVMGGLGSENGFLRHVCKYLGSVVITINYRHAPEHTYPTATDDSLTGYRWVLANAASLGVDASSIVLGGLSAGGCLAAILSMRIAQDDTIPVTAQPKLQVLICPVIDNTATISTTWAETKFSPWLTPARMTWYRQKYFTSSTEPREWTASPCFAHPQMLSRSPRTFIAVADCDLLATEGLDYAQKLRASGVDVEVKICPGATHSVLGLAGIHKVGRDLIHNICENMASASGLTYEPESAPIVPALETDF